MPNLWVNNDALLNAADYENFDRVKEMLALYNGLERGAYRGDTVAHSIFIDVKEAINSGVLTKKQREAVELCYVRMLPIEQAAMMVGISRESMSDRLNGAVKNIQRVLLSGGLYTPKIALDTAVLEEGFWGRGFRENQ